MTDVVGLNTPSGSQTFGTTVVPNAPGVYHVLREKAGPDAFRLANGAVRVDLTAKYLNRDVLKAGNPGDAAFISHALVQRVRGYDNGRAFMSAVCCDDVVVEDFVAEHNAHDMLNCEPEGTTKGVTNIVMRRGQVGGCGYFLLGSKGLANLPVSVLLEDICQQPGTRCANALWAGANKPGQKSITLRRVSVVAGRSLSDTAHVRDGQANVTVDVKGDPSKAFFTINCAVDAQDVWVDGRPCTLDDFQWQWTRTDGTPQGVQPKITHTPGFHPSLIAQPRGVDGVVTIPGPDTPPPVDESAEIERLQFLLGLAEAARDAAVVERDAARAEVTAAEQAVLTLQAKIAAAQRALS